MTIALTARRRLFAVACVASFAGLISPRLARADGAAAGPIAAAPSAAARVCIDTVAAASRSSDDGDARDDPTIAERVGRVLADITGAIDPFGHSGQLRARFLADAAASASPELAELLGGAPVRPGVHPLRQLAADRPFSLVTMLPFGAKSRGRIGSYRVGSWPYERGGAISAAYANPLGFIEVTPANQDTYVSAHFRLREFLTKDQGNVWPKYLVLREPLLDKLELLIQELTASGTPTRHMSVMSGFRTPEYNEQGVGAGGRASNSRHQYGDAADVFVDNDGDGRLDDLNHDGRIDTRDVGVMVAALERIERRYPDLVGGAGVYTATSAHGPFVHVDVRGTRARW